MLLFVAAVDAYIILTILKPIQLLLLRTTITE